MHVNNMYRVNTPELPRVHSICGAFPSPWPTCACKHFSCFPVVRRLLQVAITSVLYPAMAVQ